MSRQKDADFIIGVLEKEARHVETAEAYYELRLITGEFRAALSYGNAELDLSRFDAIIKGEGEYP